MISNNWKAGRSDDAGEESYLKNPWLFKNDKTFINSKDDNNGIWQIEDACGRFELKMSWVKNQGFAIF